MTTQDKICESQNSQPENFVKEANNKKHGDNNPKVRTVKIMIKSLKLLWFLILIVSFLYLVGIMSPIIHMAMLIISKGLIVISLVTFIYLYFELRINDWIEENYENKDK